MAAFQQQLHHQQHGWAAPVGLGSSNGGGSSMPAEASQRAVIRSLAVQVADLQQQLQQASAEEGSAAGSPACSSHGPQRPQHVPTAAAGGNLAQLTGMFVLVKQQLSGLDRMQQQLEAASHHRSAAGSSSPTTSSSSPTPSHGSGIGRFLASTAHAAALLGAELPALRATVDVMEAEVRCMAAEGVPAASTPTAGGGQQQPAAESLLCLPAPAPAAAAAASAGAGGADLVQSKAKWKARCKEVQTQLAAATSAAQQVEAALRAQLADAERAASERAAQQAGVVEVLQARVEELAAAGAQLESLLQDTAGQLTEAAGAAAALQQELDQQAQQHSATLQVAEQRLAVSQVGGWPVAAWVRARAACSPLVHALQSCCASHAAIAPTPCPLLPAGLAGCGATRACPHCGQPAGDGSRPAEQRQCGGAAANTVGGAGRACGSALSGAGGWALVCWCGWLAGFSTAGRQGCIQQSACLAPDMYNFTLSNAPCLLAYRRLPR